MKRFSETEVSLLNFLSTHHSEEIEARAHFYLAQAYYFQDKYEQAFLEFLLAEDKYYKQVQIWINACFRKLYSQ